MGRIIAIVLGIVLVLGLLVGGGIYYIFSNIDELVRRVIEQEGTAALGVPVKLDGVEIVIQEGRATLRGLTIANPEGFSDASIFELGEISVAIETSSLESMAPLVINEVKVSAPRVRYEVDAKGASNVDALEAGMKSGDGSGSSETGGSDGEELKLRVVEFLFEKGAITADLRAIGEKEREIELPALRLKDLGGRDGATAGEIGDQAVDALTDRVVRQVTRAGVERVVEKALDGVSDDAKGAVKGLLDQLGR